MSNYESCIFILTQLIGFEKSDNGEKLTLPDQVEIDTLIQFRNFLQSTFNCNDESSSPYEMKMVDNNKSFWSCNHCTYDNPIELNTCQMCALPRNVCVNPWGIFRPKIMPVFFLYIIFLTKQNDEKRGIRGMIAQKNMSDDMFHRVICKCAQEGWVEEFKLAMNIPRSLVECFDI